MLSVKQLQAVQKVGLRSLTTTCRIYKRQAYAHDDSNPYGDDTVTYATTATKVKGWLVPVSKVGFSMNVSQILTAGNFMLRVPVGTDVEPGDKVTIESLEYVCSESTTEQTWPEWLNVNLRRIQ